jgi:hypothetical protein
VSWLVTRLARYRSLAVSQVQQKSTATGPDEVGPAGTRKDGDLRRWTRTDVLPGDGMQGVWGSNPHSSTRSTRSEGFSKPFGPAPRSPDRHLTVGRAYGAGTEPHGSALDDTPGEHDAAVTWTVADQVPEHTSNHGPDRS